MNEIISASVDGDNVVIRIDQAETSVCRASFMCARLTPGQALAHIIDVGVTLQGLPPTTLEFTVGKASKGTTLSPSVARFAAAIEAQRGAELPSSPAQYREVCDNPDARLFAWVTDEWIALRNVLDDDDATAEQVQRACARVAVYAMLIHDKHLPKGDDGEA